MQISEIESPLIVIVGPTASGKTSLAIDLAEQYGGEIICADSRTIYQGMDIATAKPTRNEQKKVKHWGLDLAVPTERYTVVDFQKYAKQKIKDIRGRGKVPFLVGGTGLYINAVVYDYDFPAPPSEAQRIKIQAMSLEDLIIYCTENNIQLPSEDKNIRRVQKAALTKNAIFSRRNEPIKNTIVVGIATEMKVLEERIAARAEQMFDDGVVDEAIMLGKKYGWNTEAMTSNVYRPIKDYLDERQLIEEVKANFKVRDRQLAKRQLTWFRRDKNIRWLDLDESRLYLSDILSKQ